MIPNFKKYIAFSHFNVLKQFFVYTPEKMADLFMYDSCNVSKFLLFTTKSFSLILHQWSQFGGGDKYNNRPISFGKSSATKTYILCITCIRKHTCSNTFLHSALQMVDKSVVIF